MNNENIFIIIDTIAFLCGIVYICYNKKNPGVFAAKFTSGFVLVNSSIFHLLFGEGHIVDYEQPSWDWWTDTYEVTVVATSLVMWIVFTWSMKPFNTKSILCFTTCGIAWLFVLFGKDNIYSQGTSLAFCGVSGVLALWYTLSVQSVTFILNYSYFIFGQWWLFWSEKNLETTYNWIGIGLGFIYLITSP